MVGIELSRIIDTEPREERIHSKQPLPGQMF
jgi:hypothetical protein